MTRKYIWLNMLFSVWLASAARGQQLGRFAVHFGYDAPVPSAAEQARLDSLVRVLPPGVALTLTGHADSVASTGYNQRLSQHRTDWVRSHLIASGITASRLTCAAHGETAPATADGSEAGRARNRRVDITWLQSPPPAARISDFVFDAAVGLDTFTTDSVYIRIPPHALTDRKGALTRGQVRLRFHNFKDRVDQIQAGMSLDFEDREHWYLYNSAGMFGVWAMQGADTLRLLPSAQMRIAYPLRTRDLDLSFFKYIGAERGWLAQDPVQPSATVAAGNPEHAIDPARPENSIRPDNPEKPISPTIPENPIGTHEPDKPSEASQPPAAVATIDEGDTAHIDAPDSLGVDAFGGGNGRRKKEKPQPLTCKSCDCVSATFLRHLASSISLRPLSEKDVDLRLYYVGAVDSVGFRRLLCQKPEFVWSPAAAGGVVIHPSFKQRALPEELPGLWRLRAGTLKHSPVLEGHTSDDIRLRHRPGSLHFRLTVAKDGRRRHLRARWLGNGGAKMTRKELRETLDLQWEAFVNKGLASEGSRTSNMNQHVAAADCPLGLPISQERVAKPLEWLRKRKRAVLKNAEKFLEACAPEGCCPGDTGIGPPILPPPLPISKKSVIIDHGAVPIVMLDDFGMYNWDAIDTLPDPTWAQLQFMDASGQPIQNARVFLLIGEINGVISYHTTTPQMRISPPLRNQWVLIEPTGTVHYCTAEVFRAAYLRGDAVTLVPCVTVPHKFGDPPLDLREVLPFQ